METTDTRFVLLKLAHLSLAIKITSIKEIINMQQIDEVPNVPPMVAGVINLRGKIIPVVRLDTRFGLEERPFNKQTRIIILNEEEIGLIIDRLLKVVEIEEQSFEVQPYMVEKVDDKCFNGFVKVNDELIGILNLDQILYPEER